MKKAKLVLFLLAILCFGIGLVALVVSFFVTAKPLSHRWLLIGVGYLGGGGGFLLLRLLCTGYENVVRFLRNAKAETS